MPIAFYIVPIVRINPPRNGLLADREIALNIDFPQLEGQWDCIEILGNRTIVKINTTASNLLLLNAAYKRIPKDRLDDTLSSLSNAAKTALRDEILDMGYTLQEINNRFPDGIGNYTLRDALRFMATRRIEPNYDANTDSIVFTGDIVVCGDIDLLDRRIT